jgi:hypothetical protein
MCDQESCAEDCDSWISEVEVVTVLRECLCVSPPPELRGTDHPSNSDGSVGRASSAVAQTGPPNPQTVSETSASGLCTAPQMCDY